MDEGTNIATAVGPRLIIERPRLTRQLDKSNARIILLVAPAGYGKTTLAKQWLQHRDHAWYQATSASADAAGFSQGLDRILHRGEDDRDSLKSLIVSNPALADDPVELANILAERLVNWPRDRWIAIDDYHLVGRSETADALFGEFVAITGIRLFVTSRLRPRWAAARRVIYGEVMEIDMAQLAMTDEEAQQLLGPSPAQARIQISAEGWPALLGLAASTRPPDTPHGLPAPLVYEFIANELLAGAPPELEQMLFEIASAPSMARDVIARVPNDDLVREAVSRGFIREEPDGFSMHPLAEDFLAQRIQARPDRLEIASTIATRLLDQEQWDAVFGVVETFELPDHLDELLIAAGISMLRQGRFETVAKWVECAKAMGSLAAIADVVDAAIWEYRADYQRAHRLASSAASRLGRQHTLYPEALILAARSAYMSDRTLDAISLYRRALGEAKTTPHSLEALLGAFFASIDVESALAEQFLSQLRQFSVEGDPETELRLATAELMYAIHYGRLDDTIPLAAQASRCTKEGSRWANSAFFFAYSAALTAAGHYESALEAAQQALRDARQARLGFAIPHVQIRLANANIGLGHFSDAARILSHVLRSARLRGDRYFESFASASMIRLLISQHLAADALAPVYLPQPNLASPVIFAEHAAARSLAFACVGDVESSTAAAEASKAANQSVEATVLIETARLVASVRSAPFESENELKRLLRTILASGSYDAAVCAVRGSDMLREYLMERVSSNINEHGVISRLITLAAARHPRAGSPRSHPTEGRALSARELEVVELLKQGLSNKQMAAALFISEVTVKVHLRHIYDKLGVRRRTEAALWAQSREVSD